MSDLDQTGSSASLPMRALAIGVIVFAGWFLLKVIVGVLATIATAIVVVAAIIALIWAIRTL